jgi:hypothetical protein
MNVAFKEGKMGIKMTGGNKDSDLCGDESFSDLGKSLDPT